MKGDRIAIHMRKQTSHMKSGCKHEFKHVKIKSWWAVGLYIYCPKCGSWEMLL